MALIKGTNWDDDLYGDVYGFAEDDDIYGYAGSDFIVAGSGNDDVYGGSGHDWLYGGQGNDWLFGGYDDDVLYGEAGHDDLYGEAGHDDLSGGAGADDLYGGAGDDWLSGGAGSDYLSGGAGSDVFFFSAGSSGITGPTADVITDWDGGFDWVDTAVVGTSGNYREAATTATSIESAASLAESTFTHTSISHVFLYNSATDVGYLLSDLNNDDRFETGAVLRSAGYAPISATSTSSSAGANRLGAQERRGEIRPTSPEKDGRDRPDSLEEPRPGAVHPDEAPRIGGAPRQQRPRAACLSGVVLPHQGLGPSPDGPEPRSAS